MAVQNNVITSTDYLAVVDKFYKPKENEKIVELLGRRLLIKNQKALDNYAEMAAFSHEFAETVFFPMFDRIYIDPEAPLSTLSCDSIDIVSKISIAADEKMHKSPLSRKYDFSTKSFDAIFKQLGHPNSLTLISNHINEYRDHIRKIIRDQKPGESIKDEIEHERADLLLTVEADFEIISAVYSYCLKTYGYDVFTALEIDDDMTPDSTLLDKAHSLFLDIMSTDSFSYAMVDKVISLICIDPFFMGGKYYKHLALYSGDEDREIYRAVCDLYPELGKNWDREMLSMIDDKYEIPYSRDKVELKKALILLEEKMSDDHKELGLPESVVSPKLQEVRAKIRELSSDITHDEHLQQYYEEARKTSKYSPKSKSVAMLLLFVGGIFGAHKFYEGRKKMGILYFFTMGLLFIGLIMDFIVLYEMPSTYIPGQKYSE